MSTGRVLFAVSVGVVTSLAGGVALVALLPAASPSVTLLIGSFVAGLLAYSATATVGLAVGVLHIVVVELIMQSILSAAGAEMDLATRLDLGERYLLIVPAAIGMAHLGGLLRRYWHSL